MSNRSAAVLILALFAASPLLHAQTSINFDALNDGDSVTTQFSGLTFSNAQALTAGFSLNNLDFPAHSGPNAISDTSGPITITFSTAISAFSGYFTHAKPITVTALDGAGNQLATTSSSKNNAALSGDGSAPNELLSLTGTSIAKIVITADPNGNSLVADDLSYTIPAPPTGGGGGGGGAPPAGGTPLTFSPASVTINATVGGSPGTQTVTLSYQTFTPGAPSFSGSFNTNQGQGWLSISPVSGTMTQAALTGLLYTYTAAVTVSADPTGIAVGSIYTGTINFTSAGSIVSVPVTLNVTAPSVSLPQPTGGIANAASAGQATPSVVAPGSYVAIYGTALAGTGNPAATSLPLPFTLNGTQATLCGLPMPLLYAGPTQINALIPQAVTPNVPCPFLVTTGATQSAPIQLTVAELQPGIYTVNETGSGPGIVTEALTGQLNSASNPAHAGDYLVIYATGLGALTGPNGETEPADGAGAPTTTTFHTTSTVTATIGGVSTPVLFSGLTATLAALYQVNIQVPVGVTPGNAVPVVITSTDPATKTTATSNTVTIAIQ